MSDVTRTLRRLLRGLGGGLIAATLFVPAVASAAPPPAVVAAPSADAAPTAGATPSGKARSAALDPDRTVTWAVEPADEAGPDGRRWIELTLDPGATVVEHLAVRNLGAIPATFSLEAADGLFTPEGGFTILTSDEKSTDAGTWIELGADSVTVAPGQTKVVALTVDVPRNATPGDHAAGVAATVQTTATDGVTVDNRVGFRVMAHVAGDLAPALTVTNVRVEYATSWNPFAPGSVTVRYDVRNTGNTRLAAEGTVRAGSPLGSRTVEAAAVEDMMPGDTRSGRATVPGVWPGGSVSAEIALRGVAPKSVEYQVAAASGDGEGSVWAVPWPQLALLVVLAGAVVGFVAVRRSRRRKLEGLLAEARERGRSEAAQVF